MKTVHQSSQAGNQADSVFLNVPYDESFAPLFLAYLCGISAHGFVPRVTLELQGGVRRLDRIISLIEACQYSIHDMSRVDLDPMPPPTPRFNMPFELGLSVLHSHREPTTHTWFVFESTPWRIMKSLSDLNGTDPYIHHNTVEGVFQELAKAFVHAKRRPSVKQMTSLYNRLARRMPLILANAAATDPFNSRVFRDTVMYISALATNLS